MTDSRISTTRRALLAATLGSMALSAAIGVLLMLLGDFGELSLRIFGTTLSVTWLCLTSLACATAAGRPALRPLAGLGIASGLLGAALGQVLLWGSGLDGAWMIKAWGISNVVSGAVAYVGLLARARSPRRFGWIRHVTMGAAAAIAAILCLMIGFEHAEELTVRALGALSVVLATGTVSSLVLHRVAPARERARGAAPTLGPMAARCPLCERPGEVPVGVEHHCEGCGLGLRVEILPATLD